MKKGYTHISVLLDRSGSMASIKDSVTEEFNKLLREQKEVKGKATFTFAQFDDKYDIVERNIDLKDAKNLDLVPRGMTALLDGIGKLVAQTGEDLAAMPESERPENVVFIVITDGGENSSQEYTREKIFEMIKHQEDTYNWTFVYLGANQDAIAVGGSFGFSSGSTMTYNASAGGVSSAYCAVSSNLRSMRLGETQDFSFTDEQREESQSN